MEISNKKEIELFEKYLLLNSPLLEGADSVLNHAKKLLNGDYEGILENESCSSFFASLSYDDFEVSVNNSINASIEDHCEWMCIGIASLLYFVQNNWIKISQNNDIECVLPLRKKAISILSLEDQCNENVEKPELLYLAKTILSNEKLQCSILSVKWWLFRANNVHQIILEDTSATLYENSENLIKSIAETNIIDDAILKTLFNTEVTYFYINYGRILSSEKSLQCALNTAMLSLELKGALGKRTKYQQEQKAQLYLHPKTEKNIFPYRASESVPSVINLSDELRLEKIQFTEETNLTELGSYEESLVLASFFHLQRSQPKDELAKEELSPYLNFVIDNTKNWSLKMSALHQRCAIESDHKRTIERALSQMEYLIVQLNSSNPPVPQKMDLFFASGLKPSWLMKKFLADLMLNIGMVKGALEYYQKLSLWEDVIVCHTLLDQKHLAAEIILQELNKKPTVKLWCLLGDATQNVNHYETAWKLSGEKSSRVQRHWGMYYYSKQNYAEAIPHLKLSVELNNIQENVWVRLGFAALQIEDWKLAASAYRKYCSLEQSSFEVWNNLAKAYIKLGDKPRAWRALQDAVKCNFDKWEVWDNLMVVCTDLGNFSEVIRCYHRILDLKGAHVDIQVLTVLSKAIVNNIKDSDDNTARKHLQKSLELFGRITAAVTTNSDVWMLYAELTLLKNNDIDNQKAAQYYQRAFRAALANPRCYKTIEDTNKVLETCLYLAETSLRCSSSCTDSQKRTILSSAKLPLQSVIKRIKDLMWADKSGIEQNLAKIEDIFKKILDSLEKLDKSQAT